jgi:hypothetical protein
MPVRLLLQFNLAHLLLVHSYVPSRPIHVFPVSPHDRGIDPEHVPFLHASGLRLDKFRTSPFLGVLLIH